VMDDVVELEDVDLAGIESGEPSRTCSSSPRSCSSW
jgi:hypothetical protein